MNRTLKFVLRSYIMFHSLHGSCYRPIQWLNYMLSHPNPALTISTSYDDSEETVPLSYARRVCNSFAQLGPRLHLHILHFFC
jgi:hypothetical protein